MIINAITNKRTILLKTIRENNKRAFTGLVVTAGYFGVCVF